MFTLNATSDTKWLPVNDVLASPSCTVIDVQRTPEGNTLENLIFDLLEQQGRPDTILVDHDGIRLLNIGDDGIHIRHYRGLFYGGAIKRMKVLAALLAELLNDTIAMYDLEWFVSRCQQILIEDIGSSTPKMRGSGLPELRGGL